MKDLYIAILCSRGQTPANQYRHTQVRNGEQQKQPDVCVSRSTAKSCCSFLRDKRQTFLMFCLVLVYQVFGICTKVFQRLVSLRLCCHYGRLVLKFSQLTLEPANEKEPEKLIYVSFGEKNNLGGLKHRSFKQKRIEHYANNSTPDRCLVHLYKKYVSKCPESAMAKNVFYLTPRRGFKHSDDGKSIHSFFITITILFCSSLVCLLCCIP